ncbi:hypothetical protein ACQ4PT_067237 [Festuca glaucescens]
MVRMVAVKVRKAAEETLSTVVFLSIWGGGAGVGEWTKRRRQRNLSQQGHGRTKRNPHLLPLWSAAHGAGPVYWAGPVYFFLPRCFDPRQRPRETGAPISALLGAMRPLPGKLDMLLLVPPQGCSKRMKDGMCLLKDDVEEISSYLDELSEVEDPPPMAKSDMENYIDSLYVSPADPSLVASVIKTTRSHHKLASHVKTRLKWQQQIEATLSEFRAYVQEAIQ